MRSPIQRLTLLCAGALLLACAQQGQRAVPVAASLAPAAADSAYQQARSAHLAGRYAEALSAYQNALLADPEHVNARNGLATLHAEQGDFARAIPMWRALTARAAGPESAYLFSNLGHAHYLNGDYDSALAALERAVLLDPLGGRNWQRLGAALEKLGQHGRAQLMFKQAAALQAHDLKADYAATERAAVPAIERALQAAGGAQGREWGSTEVRQSASGVFELHRLPGSVPPAPVKTPEVPAPLPPAMPAARAMLEIRNGNGVAGMARSLARKMDGASLQVVRLSNQKGFKVQHTRVEFQPPFRDAAQQLAARFPHAAVVQAGQGRAPDVRLVLGHDVAHARLALRPLAKPSSFVQHQVRAGHARDNGADPQSTSGAQP